MNRNDYDAEEICGFKVSNNRKKLWHCELLMLEKLERICSENNLDYFLIYGSALGAVRHKGFIPWDDDIDIGMIREDFDKLLKVINNYFDENYEIQYGYRKPVFDFILRIRDKRTTGITYQELNAKGCKGVFIEIYPFDHVNKNVTRIIQIRVSKILYKLMIIKSLNIKSLNGIRKLKRLLVGFIPKSLLWRQYDWICKLQNNRDTEYVDLLSVPSYAERDEGIISIEDVRTTIKTPFEYTQARIPINYDRLLKNGFGDYMQLPPIEERGKFHENIVFYDPNLEYTNYENSDVLREYFSNPDVNDKL